MQTLPREVAHEDELARQRTLVSEEYVVKTMPPILGTFDMLSTYLLIVFFITNAPTAAAGGPSAFTYLLLGGITFFIPSVIATAQLGVMFPNEGSLYNWTHKAFGGFWSFFSAFCAWFPGILVMISAGDALVSFLQGLHSQWLADPREQGVVIIAVILLGGIMATLRLRTLQNIVNIVAMLTLFGALLVGLAGVVWLLHGHASATNFSHPADWNLNWNPSSGNINLFGLVTLAYLGAEGPLNMAGEIKGRKVIQRHLTWGTILVFVGYLLATFSLLVVQGAANASATPFSLVTTVNMALGSAVGDIVAICIMSFFVVTIAVYGVTYARLPMVAAIDRRLPVFMARLNKYRVPANAVWLQVVFAVVITLLIFFVIPSVIPLGTPVDLSTEVYNVMLASSTLVWAFSTLFLFVNLAIFYFRDPVAFNRRRIFPLPVLFIAVPLGSVSCILAIIDTLFYSWIGTLINNAQWLLTIGGVTIACIIVAVIGSMYASSQATWEGMGE
jgi:amino acid transporter